MAAATQRMGRGCHPVPSMQWNHWAQFLKSKPLFGPPTAPGAPLLSLGHLVVVAMETTSKMACKSTQAITREGGRRGGAVGEGRLPGPAEGRAGDGKDTRLCWRTRAPGRQRPCPRCRINAESSRLPPTQPQAVTGARRGGRARSWGAGFWGRPLCQGKALLARRHLTHGRIGGATEDLSPNPGWGARPAPPSLPPEIIHYAKRQSDGLIFKRKDRSPPPPRNINT